MFTKKNLYMGTIIVSASVLIFTYGFSFLTSGSYRSTLASKAAQHGFTSASPGAADQNAQTGLNNNSGDMLSGSLNSEESLFAGERTNPGQITASRGEERVLPRKTPTGELILEKGVTCDEVTRLQENLNKLGYLSAEPTGYFGELTLSAVVRFQKDNIMTPDGQAGPQTVSKIEEAVKNNKTVSLVSAALAAQPASDVKSTVKGTVKLLPWFGQVENIFSIGSVATVTDVDTGLSFRAKRTYGYNHADCEPLTYSDTETLKKIAGGSWNWTRRAVVVEVGGYRIAGSITAMPHAGRDDKPANAYVEGRSGDYGYGVNLDTIKGNGMDGQFDIHFYGSKTHITNSVDDAHQQAIQKAFKSGQ